MYLATRRETGEKLALKRIQLDSQGVEETRRILLQQYQEQVQLMTSLDHPNIVRYFDCFEALGDFWIVYELCEGGDLLSGFIDKNADYGIPEKEVMKILFQLCLGL